MCHFSFSFFSLLVHRTELRLKAEKKVEKGCKPRQECFALNRHEARRARRRQKKLFHFLQSSVRSSRAAGTTVEDCCVLVAEGGVIIKGTNPHETSE